MKRRVWAEMLVALWMVFVFVAYVANVILPKIQGKI